jgi:hypothetical protein
MAKNTANKTTAAKNTANKTTAAREAVAPSQSEAISELTNLVKSLMAEIKELKAKAVNSEIKTVPPAPPRTVQMPANRTLLVPNKTPDNKTAKVNVVPPTNGFVLLSENESVSEVVTIASIGNPFWGKGFNGRSVMKCAVNCVTQTGNTIVVFLLLNRDAVGNTINSGLVGGASYVITGVASGKTSEFNGNKANIINKAKFSPAS